MSENSVERSGNEVKNYKQELGNVPELRFPGFTDEWKKYFLSDISERITKGTTPSSTDFKEEGINFIKIENLIDYYTIDSNTQKISKECHEKKLSRSILKENDLLFSIAGALGRTLIISNEMLPANTNQALSIIRLKNRTNVSFINYLLNLCKIRKYIYQNVTVGAQPNLSLEQVGKIRLQIPSITEQQEIVNFLSVVDRKIKLMEKKISINNMIRHYYINHFYTKNEQNFVPLGNFIKQLSTKNKENEEYEVLSINNKKGFVKQKDQFGEHEVASSDKHNYKIINYGNYAYNPARINVGSIARLEEFDNGIISPMYIMFDIKNEELSSDYLKFYFDSETFKYNMLKRLEGSVRQTLSFDALKNIPIYVPNYEMQEKTSKFLKVYDQEINLLQRKIMTNKKFKQTLLSKMFC